MLSQSIIIQRKKGKQGDGGQKRTISPGQMLHAPKLYGHQTTGVYGASAIPSLL